MFLWVMAELAVICADTQEVIGSAVGLRLLTGMPIIMGVIATIIISLVYLNDPGDPSFTEVRPKNHRDYFCCIHWHYGYLFCS